MQLRRPGEGGSSSAAAAAHAAAGGAPRRCRPWHPPGKTPCPNASTVAAEAAAPARRRELERVNAEEVHIDRYARQVRRSTPSRDGGARGPGAGRSVLPTRAARGGDSGGERPRGRGRPSRRHPPPQTVERSLRIRGGGGGHLMAVPSTAASGAQGCSAWRVRTATRSAIRTPHLRARGGTPLLRASGRRHSNLPW